jgi:hypothetical protein
MIRKDPVDVLTGSFHFKIQWNFNGSFCCCCSDCNSDFGSDSDYCSDFCFGSYLCYSDYSCCYPPIICIYGYAA